MDVESGRCPSPNLFFAIVSLACVDGTLAFVAFSQVVRIHLRNPEAGWTRQIVLHLMIGSSNLACPEVLFLATFLLLLSFWVDLCHQANDDENDEDDNEENSYQKTLLEKSRDKKDSPFAERQENCCSFQNIEIESRQKFVVVVVALIFVLMISFAVAIWIGKGENPIDSLSVAQAYVCIFAVTVILLGGALGCYGTLLFLKLRKVRFERASAEMWKVAGLAAVSVVCFTSNALVALLEDAPLFYSWDLSEINGIKLPVLLLLCYFIGFSVPSAALLWVIRELPRPSRSHAQGDRAAATVISYVPTVVHHPKTWVAATSATNQVLRVSPI